MVFIQRGSTSLNTFEVPVDKTVIEDIIITYSQNDSIVFTKDKSDCEIGDYYVKTKLTQEETLMLSDASPVQIQLKIQTGDEDVIVSEEIVISVKKCLNDEVM